MKKMFKNDLGVPYFQGSLAGTMDPSVSRFNLNVFNAVGMDENNIETKTDIIVYPNPVINELNISVKNNLPITKVELFNQLGQKVLESNSTQINVSQLTTGVYLLKATNANSTYNSKIIKQ